MSGQEAGRRWSAKTAAARLRFSDGTARYVLVTGNPNSGKSTLFNALTGLRAKVGNYPGVTVERKEGRMQAGPEGLEVLLLDLPGTYSLSPHSPDEQVTRDVLFQRVPEVPAPGLVLVVADASNLQRNLYFASQVIELGYPTILALNMMDVARENGHEVDAARLEEALAVPVVPVVASRGEGVAELRGAIVAVLAGQRPAVSSRAFCQLPPPLQAEVARMAALIESPATRQQSSQEPRPLASSAFPSNGASVAEPEDENQAPSRKAGQGAIAALPEALLLLSDDRFLGSSSGHYPAAVAPAVEAARRRLEVGGVDWRSAAIEARYRWLSAIQEAVSRGTTMAKETVSDRLDRVLTHKLWGSLAFVGVLVVIFQSIFTLAGVPMEGLEHGVSWLGQQVDWVLAPGPLHSLLVDGVISGVGAVLVFLPQICLLFLFLGLLEDSGYMARAAFLMDRVMSKVGLHGKSFIPMLSSFACAIPGIMATRTIENARDRLATILVAPLLSCSARLPVYTILIAACIPDRRVLGLVRLPGLVLLMMYLLGIVAALAMAWLFKRTLLRGPAPVLIMELPPYRRPLARAVARHVWERARIFLTQAGTVILSINILLWFLVYYPRDSKTAREFEARRAAIRAVLPPGTPGGPSSDQARSAELARLEAEEKGAQLRASFAGRLGRFIEPVLVPLGFDWKIGIGIISSFAAREVFVSTMSQVYNLGEVRSTKGGHPLVAAMRGQTRPDGSPLYTARLGLALMVFYVFALQCVSTVAVVRRETASWKWPLLQWAYLGVLAWLFAFLTWQGGAWLGWR